MKKLATALAIATIFATPALAQSTMNWNSGESRQMSGMKSAGVQTSRGLFTDPDPFIRGSLERNYNHYQTLNN